MDKGHDTRSRRTAAEPAGGKSTLVFLNRYFHPDHSATSQMLSDLAFGLVHRRHSVAVIASRQRYDAPQERLPARETVGGVDVHRVWTSHFGRRKLIGRAADYATFYISAAFALWRLARSGDIIIAMTDPPMFSVIAAPIARWRDARLVNWLQDLFPEVTEAVGLDGRQLPSFFYSALRAFRNWSLRSAALNVALGGLMAEKLLALGVPPNRISVIENWTDGTLIEPVAASNNSLRREWGLDGKFVVGYSGNLGYAHDYKTLLDAIIHLERATPTSMQIVWLFIGGGALHRAFERDLRAQNLKSVIFKPYQPRDMLAQSLSAADVHLVQLRPELEGLIVPSKFYGVAAAGRPTIFVGDQDGEIARIIQRDGLGYIVPQGDGAGLAARVLALSCAPDLCRKIGARARQACETAFEKRIAIDRWESLFKSFPPDA